MSSRRGSKTVKCHHNCNVLTGEESEEQENSAEVTLKICPGSNHHG